MSTLAAALAWAARGFRVFPLAEGTKDQPVVDEFYDVATSDPVAIAMWWRDPLTGAERNYNVGVSTNNMIVVDIDTKRGLPGMPNYIGVGGHFDTLVVKTPTDGRHAYFIGPNVAGRVGFLGKDSGLDLRSWHNYVLAPGSETSDGVYSLEVDAPLAELPQDFKPHLRAPMERPSGDLVDMVETTSMVERAVTFLLTTSPAAEGSGGDDHTFKTAARLRDLGISEATAALLMAEHFNPRCMPPWQEDELRGKVANAYAYGTAAFGQLSPEMHYGEAKIPEGEMYAVAPDTSDETYRFGNAVDPMGMAQRPWLYAGLLMRRKVTLISAAGSTGKSLLLLEIAAHLAMGKPFHGYKLKDGKATRSIIYNGEDDLDEQSRRLWGVCSHFKFDWPTVKEHVAIVSRTRDFRLTVATGDPPSLNNDHVVPLVRAALKNEVGFIGLDPLVTIHATKEADNVAMRYVMETCDLIAGETNASVGIAHHISKPGANSKMDDMYAARGGGEIVNAVRMGLNLSTPSVLEAQHYNISPDERLDFVAMTDAKFNNLKAAANPRWFRKKTIRLPNGDEVGVLDPYDMAAKHASTAALHAAVIAATMVGRNTASCTMGEAADMLKASDSLMEKITMKEMTAKVMSALASPMETADGTIKIIQEMVSGRYSQKVILE